jgi:hypothetical protein
VDEKIAVNSVVLAEEWKTKDGRRADRGRENEIRAGLDSLESLGLVWAESGSAPGLESYRNTKLRSLERWSVVGAQNATDQQTSGPTNQQTALTIKNRW